MSSKHQYHLDWFMRFGHDALEQRFLNDNLSLFRDNLKFVLLFIIMFATLLCQNAVVVLLAILTLGPTLRLQKMRPQYIRAMWIPFVMISTQIFAEYNELLVAVPYIFLKLHALLPFRYMAFFTAIDVASILYILPLISALKVLLIFVGVVIGNRWLEKTSWRSLLELSKEHITFDSLQRSSPCAKYIIDAELNILHINSIGEQFAQEMLNIDVKGRFLSPGISEWIQKNTVKVLKGQRRWNEAMIEGVDQVHYYYVSIEPTTWKRQNAVRLIFKDISEYYTRNLFIGQILKSTGLKIKQLYDKYKSVNIGEQMMTPHMMHDFYFTHLEVASSITLHLSDLDWLEKKQGNFSLYNETAKAIEYRYFNNIKLVDVEFRKKPQVQDSGQSVIIGYIMTINIIISMILELSIEDENLSPATITLDILGVSRLGNYDCLIKTVFYTDKCIRELRPFFTQTKSITNHLAYIYETYGLEVAALPAILKSINARVICLEQDDNKVYFDTVFPLQPININIKQEQFRFSKKLFLTEDPLIVLWSQTRFLNKINLIRGSQRHVLISSTSMPSADGYISSVKTAEEQRNKSQIASTFTKQVVRQGEISKMLDYNDEDTVQDEQVDIDLRIIDIPQTTLHPSQQIQDNKLEEHKSPPKRRRYKRPNASNQQVGSAHDWLGVMTDEIQHYNRPEPSRESEARRSTVSEQNLPSSIPWLIIVKDYYEIIRFKQVLVAAGINQIQVVTQVDAAKTYIDSAYYRVYFIDMEFGRAQAQAIWKDILRACRNIRRPLICGLSDDLDSSDAIRIGLDDVISRLSDYSSVFTIARNVI